MIRIKIAQLQNASARQQRSSGRFHQPRLLRAIGLLSGGILRRARVWMMNRVLQCLPDGSGYH